MMALDQKVLEYVREMSYPQPLEEVREGAGISVQPVSDVEKTLQELVERGEIVSKEIVPCGTTPGLNTDKSDLVTSLYWKPSQAFSKQTQTPSTKNNATTAVFATPRSSIIKPPSIRSRLPFRSPAKVSADSLQANAISPVGIGSTARPRASQNSLLNEEQLSRDVQRLRSDLEEINKEISELSKEHREDELQSHIEGLHEYNEMKDVGQILLGKIAEHEGTTTASLYERFGLEMDS